MLDLSDSLITKWLYILKRPGGTCASSSSVSASCFEAWSTNINRARASASLGAASLSEVMAEIACKADRSARAFYAVIAYLLCSTTRLHIGILPVQLQRACQAH